ncbi:MAG TPA: Asp23/Gls24 family envelope stress response protein [Lachnospiraceae bacterium]|jgi:uncharacterized alkaline shock family protein YloU|nr:Asp23/Gls24 family envelope stress response protein [Lachnospiraceae bacterium]
MAAKYTTDIGSIIIDDEVIAKTAGMAALDCYGVVGMASTNVKDGLVQLLLGDSLTKGIKVSSDGDAVSIEFHIIVEYGTNISTIADNLISNVKYSVKDLLGIDVADVTVFVEGIRTDKQEKA